MHMSDALVSAAVGGVMCAASAASIGYSAIKIKSDEQAEKKIPYMAVTGAFVFAAQVINVAIPGTGSSGHIGGGILLAAVLGGPAALLAVSAVLIIQCLFFADGGLLALGCNIFNIGVVPCLIIYPIIFKLMMKNKVNEKMIAAAAILSSVAGLQLGAFGVVMQTRMSGVTSLPFSAFVLLMQPIHLVIGIIEGLITAAVLCFVYKTRPEVLEFAPGEISEDKKYSTRKTVIVIAISAIIAGGIFSVFASANPDGLEWAIEKITGGELEANDPATEKTEEIRDAFVLMPDYEYKSAGEGGSATGTSAAGIAGAAMTFALAGAVGTLITVVKKRRKSIA